MAMVSMVPAEPPAVFVVTINETSMVKVVSEEEGSSNNRPSFDCDCCTPPRSLLVVDFFFSKEEDDCNATDINISACFVANVMPDEDEGAQRTEITLTFSTGTFLFFNTANMALVRSSTLA